VGWLPGPVEELLNVALVGELTVVRPDGRPVTHPLIPLYDGGLIFMHSSTLFSRKLEHIKRNPRVAVSLSDPVAMKGNADRATIQGTAHVIEDDPHSQPDDTVDTPIAHWQATRVTARVEEERSRSPSRLANAVGGRLRPRDRLVLNRQHPVALGHAD
jgi:hypothetical protein